MTKQQFITNTSGVSIGTIDFMTHGKTFTCREYRAPTWEELVSNVPAEYTPHVHSILTMRRVPAVLMALVPKLLLQQPE